MARKLRVKILPASYNTMLGAIRSSAQNAPDGRLRIALFFDCDNTIANDTASDFLRYIGEDVATFWENMTARWRNGWVGSTSFLYGLIELSHKRTIRRQDFLEFGEKVNIFDGVHNLFTRLRCFAHTICPAIHLEFYLVSSGVADILRSMPIAHEFDQIFACEWHYGEQGEILFPRRTVGPLDKRTAFNIVAKGLSSSDYMENQFRTEHRVRNLAVPFSQMIMIGDSEGDLPAMFLVLEGGGSAIAVHNPRREPDAILTREIAPHHNARGPFPAIYTSGSNLESAIEHAIFTCAVPMLLRPILSKTRS